MSLAAAVVTRWDAAGLNSSVAELYRANPGMADFGAMPEDIASSGLPRAEFFIIDDSPAVHTVGYRIRRATLTFRVYHTNDSTLETVLTSIEDNFDNAENAATGPMSLSASFGELLCVDFQSRELHPVDEGIFMGTLDFSIHWQKSRITPS